MSSNPNPQPQPRVLKQLPLRLPVDLVQRLQEYAAKAVPRASIPAHVELAIQEYLEKHDR